MPDREPGRRRSAYIATKTTHFWYGPAGEGKIASPLCAQIHGHRIAQAPPAVMFGRETVAGAGPSFRQPELAATIDGHVRVVASPVMSHIGRFVPVAFDLRRRRVRLLDLRGVDFDGPAFRFSVERLRERHPDAPLLHLGMDELLAATRDEPRTPPAGLIFHTPRSGSTLLANMLAAPDGHVVVKQSLTLNVLLSEVVLATADPEESRQYQGLLRLDRPTAEALLVLTLSRLAGCGRGSMTDPAGPARPGRVIVKPTSWAINAASALLRIFPETPAIFLSRDPAAVVASMVSAPPRHPPYTPVEGWPTEALYPFLPSLRHAPSDSEPATFFAHAWRSAAESALALPPARTLFLDYADLTGDPDGTLDRVLDHLHLTPTPAQRAAMRQQLGLYSKARSGPEAFDPAGRHHRTPLADAQRDAVAAIVGELPRQLVARRPGA